MAEAHVSDEAEGLLVTAAPEEAPEPRSGRVRPLRLGAVLLAGGLGMLAVVALLLPPEDGPSVESEAPQDHALSAAAQADLNATSELWGMARTPMQCRQMGGFVCVDRPLVCCGRQMRCNLGRCAPMYGPRPMPYGARPAYGARPGYGYRRPNLLQRLGGSLGGLNPFRSRPPPPGPMYGSGSYGGYGQPRPSPLQQLGGSLLG